jgi:hypothetical protein
LPIGEADDNVGGRGVVSAAKASDDQDTTMSRHARICQAIMQKSDDLSWLKEDERSLVEVCRKDEFEAQRMMWGGGLY